MESGWWKLFKLKKVMVAAKRIVKSQLASFCTMHCTSELGKSLHMLITVLKGIAMEFLDVRMKEPGINAV